MSDGARGVLWSCGLGPLLTLGCSFQDLGGLGSGAGVGEANGGTGGNAALGGSSVPAESVSAAPGEASRSAESVSAAPGVGSGSAEDGSAALVGGPGSAEDASAAPVEASGPAETVGAAPMGGSGGADGGSSSDAAGGGQPLGNGGSEALPGGGGAPTAGTGAPGDGVADDDNLIPDSSFELGFEGWFSFGASTLNHADGAARSGAHSLASRRRTRTFEGPAFDIDPLVLRGSVYDVALWVLPAAGTQPFKLSLKARCRGQTNDEATYTTLDETSAAVRVGWTELAGSFTAPDTCALAELFIYVEGPPAGVTFFVDDVSLYEVRP